MPAADRFQLRPGAPLALASAALFGASTPFSKLLLGDVAPELLAGLLYLGAGGGLALLQLLRGAAGLPHGERPLAGADYPWLAVVVLFGGVIGPTLLMLGLARTDAASAALLLNLEGLATMAIAWLAFGEGVDRRLLAGALAILAGAVALSWRGGGVHLDTGAALIAAACVAWGVDNNLTRKLSAADPVSIATTKGLVAGAANVLLAMGQGAAAPPPQTLAFAAVVGFLGIGVSLVFFVLALRHLGAARTGAYFSLAPFIGALIAILLLGEEPTPRVALAAALMGFGLWTHLTERHEHEHTHEALEHEHPHVHDAHHRHVHEGPVAEPHTHWHRHAPMRHSHPHYPDLHHRHRHAPNWGSPASGKALAAGFALLAVSAIYLFQARREPAYAPAVQVSSPPTTEATPAGSAMTQSEAPRPTKADEARVPEPAEAAMRAWLEGNDPETARPIWFALQHVGFAPGTANLTPSATSEIRTVAELLVAHPGIAAVVAIHPEAGRYAKRALRLAEARASAVERALRRFGVSRGRLQTKTWSGPEAPPAPGDGVAIGLFRR